jgi:gliding motility-associated-like protein
MSHAMLDPLTPHDLPAPIFVVSDSLPPVPLPCLSGVINVYTPVLGFGCDSSTLTVAVAAGFFPGDKVVLMQMQVPQVDLSNTSAFGTLLNANAIGNYAYNRVLSTTGNQIQLQFALTQAYDLSGKVQLVRVPEYDSAVVCNLTCLPWNGQTGGVLALDVKNTLTLAGDIDVSARGFRGGVVEPNIIPWVFGEMQYTYPPQSTLAAQKGEGIVIIPNAFSYGRGRSGNGGGGGNAHNGGGGGGGNAGNGGDGGLEISNLPSLPSPNTNGLGGQSYFSFNAQKALLGGAGGAGHANDALGSSGGAGGGIILLKTGVLSTNGYQIRANGEDIPGAPEHNDGQGGGGGGGSILLDYKQLNGPLTCMLHGGIGGSNPYTPDFQIHGPGGGGGGGKLMLTQNGNGVFPDLSGGLNGLTSQNLTNGALPGAQGTMLTQIAVPTDTAPVYPVSALFGLSIKNPACPGSQDGRLEVTQSTAKAWRIQGGNWQNQPVFDSLAPGPYVLQLLFSGGCTLDTLVNLLQPIPIQDTLWLLENATCTAQGTIIVTANQGVAPFAFRLNNGPWQNSGTFDTLLPGMYTISMRDARDCVFTEKYNIAAAVYPPLPLLHARAGCLNLGSIEMDSTQASSFSLNGGIPQSEPKFDQLSAGNYQIRLFFPDGCTLDTTVFLQTFPALRDTLIKLQNADCLKGGQISVAAKDGTPPYLYRANNGVWQNNGLFLDLAPGTVQLEMQDAMGCVFKADFEIQPPVPLKGTIINKKDANCIQQGQVVALGTLGTAPYQYQLDGGFWENTNQFIGLSPGLHALIFRDAAGCKDSAAFSIQPPVPLLDTLLQKIGPTCVEPGSLQCAGLSGLPPYQYQLNGGVWQSNGVFNGLSAGNQQVILQDAGGCLDTLYCFLPPPLLVQDSLLQQINPTCVALGQIEIMGQSGTPPYVFQANNGLWQSNGLFINLLAGKQILRVHDAGGCEDTLEVMLQAPIPVLDTLLAKQDATCVTNGSVQIAGIAGAPPYEYQISGGNWQNTGTFTGLIPGLYVLQVRDADGCTQTRMETVDAPPIPIPPTIQVFPACQDAARIEVQQMQALGFQLNSGPVQTSPIFNGLAPGWYALQMLFPGGCTLDTSILVPAPPILRDTLLSIDPIRCDAFGACTYQALGGTGPFTYQLDQNDWQNTGTFNALSAGSHQVYVQDALGCLAQDSFTLLHYVPLQLQLDTVVGVYCGRKEGRIQFFVTGGTPPYQYRLNGGIAQKEPLFDQLSAGIYLLDVLDAEACTLQSGPIMVPSLGDTAFTIEYVQLYEGNYFQLPNGARTVKSGTYPFQFQTVLGCDSTHVIVLQFSPRHIFVPNIFHPDENGLNAFFTIYSDESLAEITQLAVYDRWGDLIYERLHLLPNDEKNGWDGTFRGQKIGSGVYVWFATLRFVDGMIWTIKGDITLVR